MLQIIQLLLVNNCKIFSSHRVISITKVILHLVLFQCLPTIEKAIQLFSSKMLPCGHWPVIILLILRTCYPALHQIVAVDRFVKILRHLRKKMLAFAGKYVIHSKRQIISSSSLLLYRQSPNLRLNDPFHQRLFQMMQSCLMAHNVIFFLFGRKN